MAENAINPYYDNNIQILNQASWSAARDSSTGTPGSDTATDMNVRAEKISASDFRLSRAFLFFDTSFIGAGGEVTSATLRINVSGLVSGIDLGLVEATPAGETEVVSGDFDQVGSTEFAARVSAASTGQKTFTLNSSGLAAINLTGNTTFAIRQERDLDDVEPTISNDGKPTVSAVDDGTESNRPLLTINYESAPSSSLFFAM